MKIVEMKAENFKRLEAVEIRPVDDVVVLSGANDQGKSSVLDAIQAAIVGGRGMKDTPEPIRRGEERAEVNLDLGDLHIRRIWEPGKNRVEVTNADGQKYSTPQAILDVLTGSLTFDPLEFARMQPRDQRATLLRLVELPFDIDDNDRQRVELVQAETMARSMVKKGEQAVADLPKVPDDTPDEETPAAEILAELQKMRNIESANNKKRIELVEARTHYAEYEAAVRATELEIETLERRLTELRENLHGRIKELNAKRVIGQKLVSEVDALVDPDTSELGARLASLDEINRNVRQKKNIAQCRAALKEYREKETAAKAAVVKHDKARADALSTAKFPVDGLGFDDAGVTLNGLPFAQASESQRIKTSVAMGMAMNPKLRVMFVRDGSLLDNKRMNDLAEMAKDSGWQLWVEKVDESGTVGIVIEDGKIKGG